MKGSRLGSRSRASILDWGRGYGYSTGADHLKGRGLSRRTSNGEGSSKVHFDSFFFSFFFFLCHFNMCLQDVKTGSLKCEARTG